jgi:hypothetical protein
LCGGGCRLLCLCRIRTLCLHRQQTPLTHSLNSLSLSLLRSKRRYDATSFFQKKRYTSKVRVPSLSFPFLF